MSSQISMIRPCEYCSPATNASQMGFVTVEICSIVGCAELGRGHPDELGPGVGGGVGVLLRRGHTHHPLLEAAFDELTFE